MTLRQFVRALVIETRRRTLQRHDALYLAWHIEALHRQKKLPTLDRLTNHRSTAQTADEMRAALTTLSKQYGSPIRQGAFHG